jgi:uncharacterized protein YjbI with pentapeptide repeats
MNAEHVKMLLERADGYETVVLDLSGADLSRANLREANLRGADLREADLTGALGDGFIIFQAGRHQAVFAGGYGHVGCERHTYAEWLTDFERIGKDNDYSEAEIARYGAFIRLAVEHL